VRSMTRDSGYGPPDSHSQPSISFTSHLGYGQKKDRSG
jgi:hypothetical protein